MTQPHLTLPIHQAATITTSGTSSAFTPPRDPDRIIERSLLLVSVTGTVSGTSPQVSFQVQGSQDGVVWYNLGSPLAFTAPANMAVEVSSLLNYFQVVWTVTGTTPSFGGVNSALLFTR